MKNVDVSNFINEVQKIIDKYEIEVGREETFALLTAYFVEFISQGLAQEEVDRFFKHIYDNTKERSQILNRK